MASDNMSKPVTNPKLLNAQAEMRKNYNHDTQNDVINAAIRSTFLVPAVVDKETRIVADENNNVQFDNRPQARFLLVEHPKLGTYIPVYTDENELGKFQSDEAFEKIAMPFPQVAHLVEQMPNVEGFVVNPQGDALPFTRQLLDDILQQILKAQEKIKENKNSENE